VWRAALALHNGWIEVTCLGVHDEPTPLTFLQTHDGHTIALHSEYGTTRPLDVAPGSTKDHEDG
jgi:hypothetical protein